MPNALIYGVNTIAAMPFTATGDVDYLSFDIMLQHLSVLDIQGITLFGIASEFYKLTDYEKDHLAQRFLGNLAGKKPFTALSVTDHATHHAVVRARYYQSIGADALMLLPPFFLQPNAKAIQHHIFSVLDAVTIPVMVQYAPSETQAIISPENMAEIAERYPHAIFKIECNPPIEYTREFLRYAPHAVVMNGYAGLYMLDMLEVGGKGVMPGCAFVEIYIAIYQYWQSGQHHKAQALHRLLLPYIQRWMSHCEYIIHIEKQLLALRGIIQHEDCRLPNYILSSEDHTLIKQFLYTFAEYLSPIID